MRYLGLVFIILIFSTACRKKELSFTFSGQVNDATFGGVMNQADVRIYVKPLGEGEKFMASAKTGSDGRYSVTIPRDRFEFVRISIAKNNYFELDQQLSFSVLTVNQDNVIDATLPAKSWVKFEIKNQPPTSPNDEFKLFKYRGKTNCPECCPNDFFYFYGAVDDELVCATDGNTYLSYYYWIIGTQINGQDSLLTVPFDTVVRTFVY
jgi:hypothetical protein